MTKLFVRYLEIANNPESSYAKRAISTLPKELGMMHEGKLTQVKELLLTESIENTTLIQAEAYKTAFEGSEPSICMRNALPIMHMKSNVMPATIGEEGTYAPLIPEGTDIPIKNQDYDKVDFTAGKYGGRPLITNELIEDGLFDTAAMEIRKVGRSIENRLNQNAITESIDNAGLEFDTAGANQGIKALASAVSQVRAAGFNPDSFIMHPEAEAKILQEYVPTNYYPTQSIVDTGHVPKLLGLKSYVCGVVDNGTQEWGYAANGEIGMIVYDSSVAIGLGMRRDITVSNYDDPVKDLVGMAITSRFDIKTITQSAACRIEY